MKTDPEEMDLSEEPETSSHAGAQALFSGVSPPRLACVAAATEFGRALRGGRQKHIDKKIQKGKNTIDSIDCDCIYIYKRKCLYKDRSLDGNAFEGGACLV